MKYNVIFLLFALLFTVSCREDDVIVEGMKPVYLSFDNFSKIQSEAPRPYGSLGKIINVGDFLFINEVGKGIHVIDNANPANPVTILFWNIPGNTEFTIEGNTLYADNGRHLIVIDISDFTNILYVKHIEDVYLGDEPRVKRPPEGYIGFFECANSNDGYIVEWVEEELTNPQCEAY